MSSTKQPSKLIKSTIGHDEKLKLAILRDLISTEESLRWMNLDDKFLLKYLRAREGDVHQALEHISGYFKLRRNEPQLFQLPGAVFDTFTSGIFRFLPHKSRRGELMVLMRAKAWNPDQFDMYHVMSGLIPFYEIMTDDDESIQKNGVIEVLDMRGLTMSSCLRISLGHHRVFVQLMDTGLPIRYNRLHVCYASKVVDIAWHVMRHFMSASLRDRIVFHGNDMSTLHDDVGVEKLPIDLGGTWRMVDDESDTRNQWSVNDIRELNVRVANYWKKYPADKDIN